MSFRLLIGLYGVSAAAQEVEMEKIDGVTRATGRGRTQWFELLDEWGAAGRQYGEISRWLTEEHGLTRWWAQKLIVEYEQARGKRSPGIRRDGTFEVGTSKTIPVAVEVMFDAFVDTRRRKKWLMDGTMTLRTSHPKRSARFDWEDGSSRVNATFESKGPNKSTVAVTHARLADAREARSAKSSWKERLAELDSFLRRD